MPINISTNSLAVLEAMTRKQRELEAAATAQNPLAGKTAAELEGPQGLAELGNRYGAPSPYGQGVAFTTPEGVKHIRGPGPAVLEMPSNYTNDYSPQDQKKIQALNNDRSRIATDPELDRDEQARQSALDEIDTQISRIPKLSPIMREPSAQQKFDATVVTTPDGRQGYFDGKKFTPFDEDKSQEAWRDAYAKSRDRIMKDEAKEATLKDARPPKSPTLIHREAKLEADVLLGKVQMPEPGQGLSPELGDEWKLSLARLKPKWHLGSKRANEKEMKAEMADYIVRAVQKDVPAEVATADFLMRWKEAAEGENIGQDIVAEMSDAMKKEAQYGFLDTLEAGGAAATPRPDPFAFGVPRGGGTVTNEAGTATITPAPKGLEGIWPNLDEEDRAAVTTQMQRGVTARQILDTYKRAVGSQ